MVNRDWKGESQGEVKRRKEGEDIRTSARSTSSPNPTVIFFISLSILKFHSSAVLSNSTSSVDVSFPFPLAPDPVVGNCRRPREAVGSEEGRKASVWNSDILFSASLLLSFGVCPL